MHSHDDEPGTSTEAPATRPDKRRTANDCPGCEEALHDMQHRCSLCGRATPAIVNKKMVRSMRRRRIRVLDVMAKHWSEKRGWLFFPRQLRYTQPMQRGRDVYRWQVFLTSVGYTVTADSIFGPQTEAMTRRYFKREEYVIVYRWTRYKLYLMKWLLDKLIHTPVSK